MPDFDTHQKNLSTPTRLPPRTSWLVVGPADWVLQQWQHMAQQQDDCAGFDSLCVLGSSTDTPPDPGNWTDTVSGKQLSRMLGRSYDRVVLDWRRDWQINHLSQAAGMLRAGGQLVILLAEQNQWPECYGWHRESNNAGRASVYFPWWFEQMVGEGAYQLTPTSSQRHVPALTRTGNKLAVTSEDATKRPQPVTEDQQRAVAAITGLRPDAAVVLRAERGHGKTLSLVLSARALVDCGHSVVMTAGLPDHLQTLQFWLEQCLTPEQRARVQCLPWQQLSTTDLDDQAVLVDEAAVLGVPRLQWLGQRARKLVLATTTAGYEGSGLGFLLRFLPWLRGRTAVNELTLVQPIRWAADDPVARQLRAALMQPDNDAADAGVRETARGAVRTGPLAGRPFQLRRDTLLNDPLRRSQWVRLLAESHYQTRPDDLRQCLDNPAVSVWGVEAGEVLVGLMVALDEPPLPAGLGEAVWRGERRPPDQLAKQSLLGQLGHRPAADWHGARIWRLVVHPQWRRQGIAAALVNTLTEQGRTQGHDYIATSFGLTHDLWAFWSALSWQPVRLGHRRDPASGEHSLLALTPLTLAPTHWSRQAASALGESCLLQPETARTIHDTALLIELARTTPPPALSDFERARLDHWCHSHQPEESAPLMLARALWQLVHHTPVDQWPDRLLLQAWAQRLWCRKSWADIQADLHLTDRKSVQQQLRICLLANLNSADG